MRFHESVHDIYFDDLDIFGILHNARYLLLFERTIGSFWRQIGYHDPKQPGQVTLDDHQHYVRQNLVEYLRPVVGVGQVRVRVWVEKLGRTSLTFGLKMLAMDADEEYAIGNRVVVRVDPETRKPAPWSQTCRDRLDPFLEAVPQSVS
jgi:acyl-CoA thioester hydrolase